MTRPSMLCEHANECPQSCPCDDGCPCKDGMCKGVLGSRTLKVPAAPRLDLLLEGIKPMSWVILDPEMTRVIASAKTPEAAIKKAKIGPVTDPDAPRPVMLQVPDPRVKFFGGFWSA